MRDVTTKKKKEKRKEKNRKRLQQLNISAVDVPMASSVQRRGKIRTQKQKEKLWHFSVQVTVLELHSGVFVCWHSLLHHRAKAHTPGDLPALCSTARGRQGAQLAVKD